MCGIDAILHKKWKILGEIVVLEQNVNHFNTDTSQHHHRYIFPLRNVHSDASLMSAVDVLVLAWDLGTAPSSAPQPMKIW